MKKTNPLLHLIWSVLNINWYSINYWHPQYFFYWVSPSQSAYFKCTILFCRKIVRKTDKVSVPWCSWHCWSTKTQNETKHCFFLSFQDVQRRRKKTHSTSNESSLTSWRVPARVTTALISYHWRRRSFSQRRYFSVASKRLQLDFQTDFSDPTDPWWKGTRNSWFIPSLAANTTWKIKIVNIEASDPVLGSWIIIITAQPPPVFSLRVSLWSHCPKCCIFLNTFLRLPFFSFFLPCPSICLPDAPHFPQEMVMGS